jgi:hypothetical protein
VDGEREEDARKHIKYIKLHVHDYIDLRKIKRKKEREWSEEGRK